MGFFPPFTYSSQKIYYLAHFKKWLPLWLEHIGHFPERSCWRSTQRNQRKVRRPKSTWLCKKRLGTNFLLFSQHFHNRRFSITRTTTTTLHGTASTLMYFQRQSDLYSQHCWYRSYFRKKAFWYVSGCKGYSQDCQIGLIKFYQNLKKATVRPTSNTVKFILDLDAIFRWCVGRLGGGT